jgi:hypothetical protein
MENTGSNSCVMHAIQRTTAHKLMPCASADRVLGPHCPSSAPKPHPVSLTLTAAMLPLTHSHTRASSSLLRPSAGIPSTSFRIGWVNVWVAVVLTPETTWRHNDSVGRLVALSPAYFTSWYGRFGRNSGTNLVDALEGGGGRQQTTMWI